jgi:hypothetical protein
MAAAVAAVRVLPVLMAREPLEEMAATGQLGSMGPLMPVAVVVESTMGIPLDWVDRAVVVTALIPQQPEGREPSTRAAEVVAVETLVGVATHLGEMAALELSSFDTQYKEYALWLTLHR